MLENTFKSLYKAPSHLHWALANSGLDNLVMGSPLEASKFGRQGRLVRRLVGVACILGIPRFAVALVACLEVARLMYQSRGVQAERLPTTCRILVGFGAGPEKQMWQEFEAESGDPAICLDEVRTETFLVYHRPRTCELFQHIWRASTVAVPFLLNTTLEPVASNRKNTITYAALRMGKYIMYRTWWQEIEQSSISQVVFLSCSTPGFACIDAGMEAVEFRQHGLHWKSVLMPAFSTLKMITQVEADWYRQFLPQSKIEVERVSRRVTDHTPRVLIASVYDTHEAAKKQDLVRVQSLVRWAKQNNLRVIIRKHPRETDNFWPTYFPDLEIDTSQDLFEEAMMRIAPMFVVSWFSTALVDALLANIVAVSIMQATDSRFSNLVFEIPKHCLLWPTAESVMTALVNGHADVASCVSELQKARMDHSLPAASKKTNRIG